MRCFHNLAAPVIAVGLSFACVSVRAQAPTPYSNVGRPPTQQEISNFDIAVATDGTGLPPGSGNAKSGAPVFMAKCAPCHGRNLEGTKTDTPNPVAPALVGGIGTLTSDHPVRTVGSYLPYATTLWDYINRAMPRGAEHTLKPNEVYLVTAFILYKNGIIKEDDVMDANTLPKVQMPNRNGFLPPRFEDIPNLRKRGCYQGQCPESTGSK
jgi:hypothetical protein